LTALSKKVEGKKQWPYSSIAIAMEVIPRTLAANCGVDVVKVITELRAKHALNENNATVGIDGMKGTYNLPNYVLIIDERRNYLKNVIDRLSFVSNCIVGIQSVRKRESEGV
jgi:chaperonin GroEL (HSP60 family)